MLCFDYSQEMRRSQPENLKNLSTKKKTDSTDEKSNSTVSRVAVFRR